MRVFTMISASVLACALAVSLAGCPRPNPPQLVDAIQLSNTAYDFARNQLPYTMYVWNSNPQISTLTIQVRPNRSWIQVDVSQVNSNAPAVNGDLDEKAVTITIDRTNLPQGNHEGAVVFSASGITSKLITVQVTQDQTGSTARLNIVSPIFTYDDPYLVDMHFSLKDSTGHSVVAEPNQMELTAFEGTSPVSEPLNGLLLKRAAARQLRANLVFDYSLSMRLEEGAIETMEDEAKNTLLPTLNADAQVGIWEFHRDDRGARQVSDFTVDREALSTAIDGIAASATLASGSRVWDALVDAGQTFPVANPEKESRYIILFSNGNDTSSVNSPNNVVSVAGARGVRIYAIGFGADVNFLNLRDITIRTGGEFFPADSVGQVGPVFQEIVQDLQGQYNVRWASLQRDATGFVPSFHLTNADASVNYTAPETFVAADHAGDVLRGALRLAASDNGARTTVFIRAHYVPREVTELHFLLSSDHEVTSIQRVAAVDDGLVSAWRLEQSQDAETGVISVDLTSPGAPINFATFGPLLKLEFDVLNNDMNELFTCLQVDNSYYFNEDSGEQEQYFEFDNFDSPCE